ncbi:MAG: alpha-L-arabinofuranosidase C-terminal domain-containing protein [Verrucomicrobiota bacterium]|nr:alpha-L-arabinofuranosidase C-terminal domain-containing protein [Verrucomicrobiota bacterium]
MRLNRFLLRATSTCAFVLLLATQATAATALVPNGDFAQAQGQNVPGWRTTTWTGTPRFFVSPDGGRENSQCIAIESTQGADASWHANIPVEPFSQYRLTAWIRTQDLEPGSGRGAQINLHGEDARSEAISGTTDWTQVELNFTTRESNRVWVNALFGGWGSSTGTAFFDDFELERLGAVEPPKVGFEIQADQTGPDISPYIYSQFIEHLGRCIYGGMWAEMLEDRKFFFPITERYRPWRNSDPDTRFKTHYPILVGSPWRIIGDVETIEMVASKEFPHRSVAQIQLQPNQATGIEQLDLELLEGKQYNGRIVIAGSDGAGSVRIGLHWGDGQEQQDSVLLSDLTETFQTIRFTLQAGGYSGNGRLSITGQGAGAIQVAAVSLMPADNVEGFRADTLALLRELNAPLYRWPGGNFVSGYEWRDGLGNPDHRPTRRNPAWTGIDTNDVGLHEFITFCRLLNAEPLVVVNTGFGDPYSAAQEVQYINGAPDSPMGRLRSENGHPEPFEVTWFGIGNEMYGDWQLGHMSLNHYIIKHNLFVDRMREEDPNIKVITVGDAGEWSRGMLQRTADRTDLISEHFYCQERDSVIEHVAQMRDNVRRKANAHRGYREEIPGLAARNITIAMDEWNYWYGPHVFGELGTRYFMKDALGIAVGLHEFFRNSDIITMAQYAQTVNVIGCIKTTRTEAAFATTGLVLKLYRKEFGTIPVKIEGETGLVDVMAALTADRKTLTIGLVNPTDQEQVLSIPVAGLNVSPEATQFQMAHADPMTYNEPGAEPAIVIEETQLTLEDGEEGMRFTAPPYSVNLLRLPVK